MRSGARMNQSVSLLMAADFVTMRRVRYRYSPQAGEWCSCVLLTLRTLSESHTLRSRRSSQPHRPEAPAAAASPRAAGGGGDGGDAPQRDAGPEALGRAMGF